MNLITRFRKRRRTRQYRLFALFAVVWSGLLLQPCALAAPIAQTDTVSHSRSIDRASTHAAACAHGVTDADESGGVAGNCGSCSAPQPMEVNKTNDDRFDNLVDFVEFKSAAQIAHQPAVAASRPSGEHLPSGTTLNVRYCVYLI